MWRGVDLGVPVVVLGRVLSDLHVVFSGMLPITSCEPIVGVSGRDGVVCGSQTLANVPGLTRSDRDRFGGVFESELGSILELRRDLRCSGTVSGTLLTMV